jgi:hypothetical protein
VDASTVTALDVITAFAVPNPSGPSGGIRFFRVWLLFRLPCRADHPAYFRLGSYVRYPALSATGNYYARSSACLCQCRSPCEFPQWETCSH